MKTIVMTPTGGELFMCSLVCDVNRGLDPACIQLSHHARTLEHSLPVIAFRNRQHVPLHSTHLYLLAFAGLQCSLRPLTAAPCTACLLTQT